MLILLFITCLDGSQINLKVSENVAFDYTTKYGVLKVPIKEMWEVNLGIHVDDPKPFTDAIKALGDEKYGNRAAATKFLKENPRGAWKYLYPLQKSSDPEVAKRVELLSSEMEHPLIADRFAVNDGTMTGEIKQTEIEGVSDSLGPIKIKLSQIKSMSIRRPGTEAELDSATEDWLIIGEYDGRLKISVTGKIDLWPPGIGQYVTGPKGNMSAAGKGGTFMAGAVVGRGVDGKEFLIGESYSTSTFPRGRLEVRVVGTLWNSPCLGVYKVRVE